MSIRDLCINIVPTTPNYWTVGQLEFSGHYAQILLSNKWRIPGSRIMRSLNRFQLIHIWNMFAIVMCDCRGNVISLTALLTTPTTRISQVWPFIIQQTMSSNELRPYTNLPHVTHPLSPTVSSPFPPFLLSAHTPVCLPPSLPWSTK